MPEVITLTLNPCVDVSTATAKVTPTHKLRCSSPFKTPGGGGVNVARYLTRLGHSALALHTAGGRTGVELQDLLALEGVPHGAVPLKAPTRESWHVHEDSSGQEFRFVMPGPHMSDLEWASVRDALQTQIAHDKPRCVVLSGSLPPGVPADAYAQLLRWCRGEGLTCVLDASGEALRHALSVGVDWVKPSLGELRAYTGLGLHTLHEQITALRDLIHQKRAQVVVLSLGEEGAVLATKEVLLRVRAPQVSVVSAVGAGDSLVAGLVSGLLQGMSYREMLVRATAVSAATLAHGPGSVWIKKDLDTFQSQVVLEVL